jgi:hypothetical protein
MSGPYFNDGERDDPRDDVHDGDGPSWYAQEWRRKWPAHCPACRGWGLGPSTYESHGFRYGPQEEIPGDPCEALPEGTCHRCGHSGPGDEGEPPLDDGTHPCPACGWNWGEDGVPG